MRLRHRLLIVIMVTIAAWCSPMVAFSQKLPEFGPLDAGGMPSALIWLREGRESAGHLLCSRMPYFVWVAPYRVNTNFRKAPWRQFGPWTFAGRQRYIFNSDGKVDDNVGPTSTDISPGLASLHFMNWGPQPLWFIVNPLPPGLGGPGCGPGGITTTPSGHPNVVVGADGNLHPAPGYRWVNDDPGDLRVVPKDSTDQTVQGLRGTWKGSYTNTRNEPGSYEISLVETNGRVEGVNGGLKILDGKRIGNTMTWRMETNGGVAKGGQSWNSEVQILDGGNKLVESYSGHDNERTKYKDGGNYTGKGTLFRTK